MSHISFWNSQGKLGKTTHRNSNWLQFDLWGCFSDFGATVHTVLEFSLRDKDGWVFFVFKFCWGGRWIGVREERPESKDKMENSFYLGWCTWVFSSLSRFNFSGILRIQDANTNIHETMVWVCQGSKKMSTWHATSPLDHFPLFTSQQISW